MDQNVASPAITPTHWLALSRRVNEILSDATGPKVDGIVVTHGTDRLEETAFFLYLTVASERPVVICGAQRPATGLSPDGAFFPSFSAIFNRKIQKLPPFFVHFKKK